MRLLHSMKLYWHFVSLTTLMTNTLVFIICDHLYKLLLLSHPSYCYFYAVKSCIKISKLAHQLILCQPTFPLHLLLLLWAVHFLCRFVSLFVRIALTKRWDELFEEQIITFYFQVVSVDYIHSLVSETEVEEEYRWRVLVCESWEGGKK